jgi:signal peptidase I
MKQKGLSLLAVLISIAVIGVLALYFLVFRKNNQYIPNSVGEITCVYPVTIQGNSMEPALKAGSLISFNKCVEDKNNISIGKIIVYEDGSNKKIGRIKERIKLEEGFFYKITRDGRLGEEFTIPAESIIAIE